MYAVHATLQEVLSIIRRRKKLLIIPPIIVLVICTIAAFVLPRKYVSSTTIMIQRDEALNPLIRFDMAVSLASDDRTRAFEEIVFSRTTIQSLIDSLKLGIGMNTEAERQNQIRLFMSNIYMDRPGESTVRITMAGADPYRVQESVALLARQSIRTMVKVENQKNDITVQFFEDKLVEYQEKFETTRQQLVPRLQERIAESPVTVSRLSTQIEDTDRKIREIDDQLREYEEARAILKTFPEAFRTESGKQALFTVPRYNIPYTEELKPLLTEYAELSLRYTNNYPGIIKLESQILELLNRIDIAVEFEIPEQRKLRDSLAQQQQSLVASLQTSSVSSRMDSDIESTYDIYKRLYDDMKVKLEHARTNRELKRMGTEQFVVLDPPIVPSTPTKPNRMMIIMGGMVCGVLMGIVSVVLAELFDTTVRTARDLKGYKAPVVALIPSRNSDSSSNAA